MNETIPYVQGSDTSEASALEKAATAKSDSEKVMAFIAIRGSTGATDDEIERVLMLTHQNASARRNALVRKGLVCDSGERRMTRSRRLAVVWIVGSGTPVEGAPNVRHVRPSNEQIRKAVARIEQAGFVGESRFVGGDVVPVLDWLKYISRS